MVLGGSFLYSVIYRIMEENQENVTQMSKAWSEQNKANFAMFAEICSGDFDVQRAFHEKDFETYGEVFLKEVLRFITAAYKAMQDELKQVSQPGRVIFILFP